MGLQPLPALQVSEYKAKQAIEMGLLLTSLSKSQYASELWGLTDTSAELLLTPPRNTFKKKGYTVNVWFDNNENNTFPYTNWEYIYYQDDIEQWHRTRGEVDYNGLYFTENNGNRAYFLLFDSDAQTYSQTGTWTVHYKNQIISAPVTSSSKQSSDDYTTKAGQQPHFFASSSSPTTTDGGQTSQEGVSSSTTSPSAVRLRRRRSNEQQRELSSRESPRTKRRRVPDEVDRQSAVGSAPTAEEVGSRHRSLPRSGLSRLTRLQAEARDPPILLIKGLANPLKCWRYRLKKYTRYFKCMSTVFRWVDTDEPESSRSKLLVVFNDTTQRDVFMKLVALPRGCTYTFGALNSL